MKTFENYKFRASQSYLLATGTIGLTDSQEIKLKGYLERQENAKKGEEKPLTALMEKDMKELIYKRDNPELPKTMQNEIRKIYRSEKYNRNFEFTNKYVQKGIAQEDEAITLYQTWLKRVKNENTFLVKNGERLYNDFFQGEPDLRPLEINGKKRGFDIKCSWSLESFPFDSDPLQDMYEWQNQVYMNLENADEWITATCLVNCTETHLQREKEKHFYANLPEGKISETKQKELDSFMKEKYKTIEKMMIYDFDRFVQVNPYHDLSYTRAEWMEEGNDIPLEDRVIERLSIKDDKKIEYLKNRVEIARKYLIELSKK
jgi:hypothetical protein